jgi:glutamine amidotransferase
MCRFFSYFGPQTVMYDAMYNADNSLVEQSKSAQKRRQPVNGDGFGIGWYPAHDDPEPGTYVATTPAWSDRNLRNLCSKIETPLFFAHVRDASHGMPVSSTNCHPFQTENFLWMHNGYINEFHLIKRQLINLLSDKAFNQIHGNTDSEFTFALFLDEIEFNHHATTLQIKHAVTSTINKIVQLQNSANITSNASMNFVVSNGKGIVSTRYSTDKHTQPPSLFYNQSKMSLNKQGALTLRCKSNNQSIIIASEPITNDRTCWIKIDRNQIISVNAQLEIEISDL